MQRPSIRQLEYLVAVAEHLNFRAAAESCYVTQPAPSTQLQQLEPSLGLKLFERDKRQVHPTAAGRSLAEAAREVLAAADRFTDHARAVGDPLAGELRLGVIPTVGPYLLPLVIQDLRRQFPQLRLLLREERTAALVKQLHEGRLDLLLLALDVNLQGAASRPLFEDPFMLVCPADHELATRETLAEDDLESREVLLLEDGHCLRDQALVLCSGSGAREYGEFRGSSLATLVQMVSVGVGITLLPRLALDKELAGDPGLAARPFTDGAPGRRIGLAWRKTSDCAPAYTALGDAIADAYQRSQNATKTERKN